MSFIAIQKRGTLNTSPCGGPHSGFRRERTFHLVSLPSEFYCSGKIVKFLIDAPEPYISQFGADIVPPYSREDFLEVEKDGVKTGVRVESIVYLGLQICERVSSVRDGDR